MVGFGLKEKAEFIRSMSVGVSESCFLNKCGWDLIAIVKRILHTGHWNSTKSGLTINWWRKMEGIDAYLIALAKKTCECNFNTAARCAITPNKASTRE